MMSHELSSRRARIEINLWDGGLRIGMLTRLDKAETCKYGTRLYSDREAFSVRTMTSLLSTWAKPPLISTDFSPSSIVSMRRVP